MRGILSISAICVFLFVGFPLYSDEIPDTYENRLKAAKRYLEADQGLVVDYLNKASMDLPEEGLKKVISFVKDFFQSDSIKREVIAITARYFTLKELDALISFNQSPVGKSINEKMDAYTADITSSVQREIKRRLTAEQWYDKGLSLLDSEQYKEAINAFSEAIDSYPDHALAYYKRGVARRELGDYDHTIADFTKALDIAGAYHKRVPSLEERGDPHKASVDARRAFRLNPE